MPPVTPNSLMKDMASADAELDIRALLCSIMNAFGGQDVFATEVVENLHASDKGSSARTTGYNNIMQALQRFGHIDGGDDGADATSVEAELRRVLNTTPDEHDGHTDS